MSEPVKLDPEEKRDEPEYKRRKLDSDDKREDAGPSNVTVMDVDHENTKKEEVKVNDRGKGRDRGRGKGKARGPPNRRKEAPKERAEGEEVEARLPKRMTALLIGFCGSPYRGMQYQKPQAGKPNYATVEGTLFEALVRAGAISKDNSDDPVKSKLQRAARTDSGVHAAGNVVSLKMITAVPGQDDMLARINQELPPEIRVWDFVRVKNSFNARTICDSRRYTYFFPSYLLIPPKPGSGYTRAIERLLGHPSDSPPDPFWNDTDVTPDEETARKRTWRVTPEHMTSLRAITKKFEGTHNFHNFTVTLNPREPSNKRFMKTVEVTEPQVHGDTEWIPVLFHGQSFMLHQRKMMFTLIMACRTGTPPHIISELYPPMRWVQIPKVPALGLLLESPVYDVYNSDTGIANAKLDSSSPDIRPPIDFEKFADKMEQFKQDFIYSSMRSIESRTGLFNAWLKTIDSYEGDDLLWLNPEGTIPEAAVLKVGEKRARKFKEHRYFDRTEFKSDAKIDETVLMDEEEEEDAPLSKKAAEEMEGWSHAID